MVKYIKLELVNKSGGVEEDVILYTEKDYTESQLRLLVRKYKVEYNDVRTDRHYKWESYEYVKEALLENEGFSEIPVFKF